MSSKQPRTVPSSSSSTSSSSRPVLLNLTATSFDTVTLHRDTTIHVYVGQIRRAPVIVPVRLTLHRSMLEPPHSQLKHTVLPTLFTRLPSIVASAQAQSTLSAKAKAAATVLTTDALVFSYAFLETAPKYHCATFKLTHNERIRRARVHYELGAAMSDDTDHTAYDSASSDSDSGEDDGDDDVYHGGAFHSFVVSRHTLQVKCIPRHSPDALVVARTDDVNEFEQENTQT